MCGIAGWWQFREGPALGPDLIARMVAALEHRGPDAAGEWRWADGAVGYRRLAVIDVDGGVQPMVERTPDGCVVLVYNGEIYDYRAVRRDLKGAWRTRSAPPATPRWCCARTSSGGPGSPTTSTACSRSRCGTAGPSACCSSAIAWGSSRSSTPSWGRRSSSARSRRPCSSILASRRPSTRKGSAKRSVPCAARATRSTPACPRWRLATSSRSFGPASAPRALGARSARARRRPAGHRRHGARAAGGGRRLTRRRRRPDLLTAVGRSRLERRHRVGATLGAWCVVRATPLDRPRARRREREPPVVGPASRRPVRRARRRARRDGPHRCGGAGLGVVRPRRPCRGAARAGPPVPRRDRHVAVDAVPGGPNRRRRRSLRGGRRRALRWLSVVPRRAGAPRGRLPLARDGPLARPVQRVPAGARRGRHRGVPSATSTRTRSGRRRRSRARTGASGG